MKQKQLALLKISSKRVHGGLPQKQSRKRKTARPLSLKNWVHLVLKSSKAKGTLSLLNPTHRLKVDAIIKKQSRKHGVLVSDYVNMGNHIHLKIKPHSRTAFQKFLKSTTAMIARAVTGACRGNKFGKFWDALAFTRVLSTRIETLQLNGYFQANRVQARKSYSARQAYLDQFNRWVYALRLQT